MPVIPAIIAAVVLLILHNIHSILGLLGLGAACVLLFHRANRQQDQLRELQARLDALSQRQAGSQTAGAAMAKASSAATHDSGTSAAGEPASIPAVREQMPELTRAPVPAAVPETPPPEKPAHTAPLTAAARAVTLTVPTTPEPQTAAPPRESGSLPGPLRWLLAGNPVAKIGVLLLFFGLAYLFKYASDRHMLPIELRLGGAVLLAGGLLITGWRLRVKQALYGLLLQGAAIGCLYMITFAAYRLYDLLPQPLAFGLMLVICAASVMLAVLQKAQGLAMAASLGGFLAPLLLSTGGGSHIGLFSYYLLLSSGILAVSLFQSWRSLNVIGFFFTFGVGGLWGARSYVPDMYAECQLFLIAFLLIYGVVALLFAFRQPAQLRGFVDGTLVFGSPLVGFGLQYGLTRHWEFGPAFSALAFAAFYLPLAIWLLKKRPDHGRLLAQSFFALGLSFVTLAVPLGLNASWTALAWVLEGAGLIWVGSVQSQRRMLWSGVALQLAAAVAWLIFLSDGPSLVAGATSGLVLAIAWLAGGLVLSRPGRSLRESQGLSLFLLAGGLLWWMITVPWALTEPHLPDATSALRTALYLLLMCTSALGWHLASRRLAWPALGHGICLLWPVFFFAADPAGVDGLQGWAWIAWPLAIATAVWLLRQRDQDLHEVLRIALHATLAWLVAGLLMRETAWRLDQTLLFVQEWEALAWLALPAALTGLIIIGTRMRRWPFTPHTLAWLGIGCAPLLIVMGAGLVLGNVEDGRVRELGLYIPLLNPLELSAAAALLALLAWQRLAEKHWPLLTLARPLRIAVLAALAFWWGNGLLLRLLAEYGDVVWRGDTLWASRLVQTTMALAWTLCALLLMWRAAQNGRRLVWLAGALLLGVVVVKLMLVDSASGGGLARAISFIGVALLLLVIGYVAPLPPRTHAPASSGDSHV